MYQLTKDNIHDGDDVHDDYNTKEIEKNQCIKQFSM